MSATESVSQVFPPVDRVIYEKAPLVEVICQVRYPIDLRLETTPPAEFQQRIRSSFPVAEEQSTALPEGMPPEIANALRSFGPQANPNQFWSFRTEDEGRQLQLTKEHLTLVDREYKTWEEFIARFENALRAFFDIYQPPFLTRIGLRYRDIIQRSRLGLQDVPWRDLLSERVLGELTVAEIEAQAIEVSRNLVLTLTEKARARLQHGYARIGESDEQSYLIDCDFSVDRTEIRESTESLEFLHQQAGRAFRWCITNRLHEAMGPRRIDSETE